MRLPVFPHSSCVAPSAAPLCSRSSNKKCGLTYDEAFFHRMWARFVMKRNDSTRDARESVRRKTSNQMSKKESTRPPPHRLRTNKTNKGDAEAATQIFHGHAEKPLNVCGPAPAYFPVSIAFDPARNESKQIEMHMPPHRLKRNRSALVQLPAHWNGARPRRGENWRPGAPGRNDCLSERSERVSFRQRRAANSQGGMTGRRSFLGRHSFRAAGKNVGDAGIVFQ